MAVDAGETQNNMLNEKAGRSENTKEAKASNHEVSTEKIIYCCK